MQQLSKDGQLAMFQHEGFWMYGYIKHKNALENFGKVVKRPGKYGHEWFLVWQLGVCHRHTGFKGSWLSEIC